LHGGLVTAWWLTHTFRLTTAAALCYNSAWLWDCCFKSGGFIADGDGGDQDGQEQPAKGRRPIRTQGGDDPSSTLANAADITLMTTATTFAASGPKLTSAQSDAALGFSALGVQTMPMFEGTCLATDGSTIGFDLSKDYNPAPCDLTFEMVDLLDFLREAQIALRDGQCLGRSLRTRGWLKEDDQKAHPRGVLLPMMEAEAARVQQGAPPFVLGL
jgi:hypothetical protein